MTAVRFRKNKIVFGSKKKSKVAHKVFKFIEEKNKPMKPEQIVSEMNMNLRSVRYGLKLLLEAGLITKYPDLEDLRSYFYFKKEKAKKK